MLTKQDALMGGQEVRIDEQLSSQRSISRCNAQRTIHCRKSRLQRFSRTEVTGGQFKEIQISSKVVTLEKVLEQLVSGVYGYDIEVDEAVMDNVCV